MKEILLERGCLRMPEGRERLAMNKGYTEHGFTKRVFHPHPSHLGGNGESYFRDWLRANPDLAK